MRILSILIVLAGCGDSATPVAFTSPDAGITADNGIRTISSDAGPTHDGLNTEDFKSSSDSVPVTPDQSASPDATPTPIPGTWVKIKKGVGFTGSQSNDPCRHPQDKPDVMSMDYDFEIQRTEVTQGQFEQLMGYNPSYYGSTPVNPGTQNGLCKHKDCPVESVTWHEAAAYCLKLSQLKGFEECYTCSVGNKMASCKPTLNQNWKKCTGYRLPILPEWEYAYRAGTSTALYNGPISNCINDPNAHKIGWHGDHSGNTHRIMQKTPNAWGLYDMAGNVSERLDANPARGSDAPAYAMGGNFASASSGLRARASQSSKIGARNQQIGFRCVRRLP